MTNGNFWFQFASPARFHPLAGRLIPWFGWTAAVLAAIGLCGFALVAGLDAVRSASPTHAQLLSRMEIYLAAIPGIAWFAVLVELSRPSDGWRSRTRAP